MKAEQNNRNDNALHADELQPRNTIYPTAHCTTNSDGPIHNLYVCVVLFLNALYFTDIFIFKTST